MSGLLGTAREGLDAQKYRKSPAGKKEKKARKAHNKKFSPNLPAEIKRQLRFDRKKADAAKGAVMKARGGTYKGAF